MLVAREIDHKQDAITVLELAKQMRDELSPLDRLDEAHVYLQAAKIAEDIERETINCWLAEDEGEAVGFFVGRCSPTLMSKEPVANHDYWFIRKDYRKSRAAYVLFKAFEEWARLRGAVKIIGNVALDDLRLARDVMQMFPRLGYSEAGGYFVKRTPKAKEK